MAKLSPKGKVLKHPKISEIRLVGMELRFAPTPGLNKESIEGQVQLFEVSFEEGGPPPPIIIRSNKYYINTYTLCYCVVVL